MRFRWSPGDVATWENGATAHLAPENIFQADFARQLYRIALVGDVPVGVDSMTSKPIAGGLLADRDGGIGNGR